MTPDEVEIEHGGTGSIVATAVDGIEVAALLPDEQDSVTVRRGLLEAAHRLAEAAIYAPSINATDDVRLRAFDQTEEQCLAADGGTREEP